MNRSRQKKIDLGFIHCDKCGRTYRRTDAGGCDHCSSSAKFLSNKAVIMSHQNIKAGMFTQQHSIDNLFGKRG